MCRRTAELVFRDGEGLNLEGRTEVQKNLLEPGVRASGALGDVQALAQAYQPSQLLVQLAELPPGSNVKQRLLM